MAYASRSAEARGFPRAGKLNFAPDGDWADPPAAPRDVKKIVLVAGLGLLSWVATYVGMLELIEANMGDLPIVHKLIIGFSVAMLMTMIIWLLDQMFAPIGAFTKLCYAAGYLFLTVISVGFGFGFYWKVLESRSESSRSAESAVQQVQGSLYAASQRLEQLQSTLVQLAAVSTEKAEIERTKGTSCPNSKPGDGPRRKMREDDAQRFTFASEMVKTRAGAVKAEMTALDADLAKIASDDKSIIDARTGTRNEFMKGLSRKLDLTVTGFNAFRTDPQLKQLRTDLSDRAETTTFGDLKKGGFVCPDAQLQQALRGAVRAIDQLPDLEKPKIAAVEGSEATIEAFRRLTATFYGLLSFKLPPSPDELRELQKKAVQSVEGGAAAQRALQVEGAGLSKRDYVPLAIALFVDLCLLLVSMGRPMNRLNNLIPKMREAERGPVIQILSRFNDIHRDAQVRQNFEVFRHVVFDFHGDYYVAVPLDAPYRPNPRNPEQRLGYSSAAAQDLQHEAHLLANLFTSFEKERIFKRVYSPFLSTKAIQKRLARQGSKFAGCEAFRVYRFKDGAWSEIILGAVMGAARRVEAEKSRRRIEEDLFRGSEPSFAPEPTATRPPFAGPQPPPMPSAAQSPVTAWTSPVAPPPAYRMPDMSAMGVSGRTPQAAYTAHQPAAATVPAAAAAPAVEPEPATEAAFGPYARHIAGARQRAAAAPAPRAPIVPVAGPANSNTAGSRRRAEGLVCAPLAASTDTAAAGTVIAMPAPADRTAPATAPSIIAASAPSAPATEDMIDVVLSQRTATFSIPVSQARLPAGLAREIEGALAHPEAAPLRLEAPATLEIEDLDPADAGQEIDAEPVIDIEQDTENADAAAIAGRLRPPVAAE